MGERTTWAKHRCPLCTRRVALVRGKLAKHKQHDDWCLASGCSTYEATLLLAHRISMAAKPPRPTCRPMLGGETGEDGCGYAPGVWLAFDVCTADDARGPA
jgi:hypothetical protein